MSNCCYLKEVILVYYTVILFLFYFYIMYVTPRSNSSSPVFQELASWIKPTLAEKVAPNVFKAGAEDAFKIKDIVATYSCLRVRHDFRMKSLTLQLLCSIDSIYNFDKFSMAINFYMTVVLTLFIVSFMWYVLDLLAVTLGLWDEFNQLYCL